MFSNFLFYLFFAIFLASNAVFFSPSAFAEETEVSGDESSTQFIVKLSESAQTTAGLQTLSLPVGHYQPESIAYGQVLAIQPLLELRKRYFFALSEQNSAKAKYTQAHQNIKRLKDLYKNQIVSERRIQSQQSQWQANKAQFNAVHFQLKAIYDESLLQWGSKLTDLILSSNKQDSLNTFITGQQQLIEISLPAGKSLPENIKQIAINPNAHRQQAYQANFLSISPRSSAINQGYSYFFIANSALLKPGMKLSAWYAEQHLQQQGVMMPKSAVFWHLGQSFVYLKTEEDEFTRIAIPNLISTPDGYFNQQQIKPGDELVITGAQMLLSEEFRAMIPDEDDDD